VGRPPRARRRDRRQRRRVAGRRRRRGDRVRRGDGPGRDRRRQRGRPGRPGPAVRGTGRPAAGRDAGRGLGGDRAGGDRQGRGPGLGSGRAGQLPAAPGAGGAAGRAEPAAGYRVRRDGPGGDPQRGAAAGPALPVGRRLHPARRRLPGAPHHAQGPRRHDLREGLCLAVPVPPPGRDPPVGLDPGRQPRRDHHRVEQEQDQGAAQPRTPPPGPGKGPARSKGIRYRRGKSEIQNPAEGRTMRG